MNTKKVTYTFHHIGIPTNVPRDGEVYSSTFGMYTADGKDTTFRIQYHRFDDTSPLHPLIKTMPHVAFKVSNMEEAIKGRNILLAPYCPFEGFKVAGVEIDGAPIEFIETTLSEEEIWAGPQGPSYIYPEEK